VQNQPDYPNYANSELHRVDGIPARLAVTPRAEIVVASVNGRDRFCLHATNIEKTGA
jgi:hypothetical protein